MSYSLTWCAALAIFRLDCLTDGTSRALPEKELRDKLGGDATLNAWVDFAKEHAGHECVYDMLPR